MSGKAIALCESEWEALEGLPYMQFKLYVVLRWYMDVASLCVGLKRGISLQGLRDGLYIEPAPGRQESGSPTVKSVRSALQQLEKHGLIQPCGNGEVLAFLLPKAGDISARPKLKGHKRGTGSGHAKGHDESLAPQGNKDEKGHAKGQPQSAIKGHTSEVRVNPLSVEAIAAASGAVDKNLSTGPVLQMPLLPGNVAEWIRQRERQRGFLARVVSSAPQIADWVASGATADEIAEAYSLAVDDRELTKNHSPINLPFLDIFVKRVINGRMASRKGGAQPPAQRLLSDDEVLALARRVGIEREVGEPIGRLRDRVIRKAKRVGLDQCRNEREVSNA